MTPSNADVTANIVPENARSYTKPKQKIQLFHQRSQRPGQLLRQQAYIHAHFRHRRHDNTKDDRDQRQVRCCREPPAVGHIRQQDVEKRLRRFAGLCNGHRHDVVAPVRQRLGQDRKETEWDNPQNAAHANALHAPGTGICGRAWERQDHNYKTAHKKEKQSTTNDRHFRFDSERNGHDLCNAQLLQHRHLSASVRMDVQSRRILTKR